MRLSKLVGRRIKETPKDAHTPSHTFLIRGGYIRQVSAGIYTLLPLARRVTARICEIIREEMNRVDGQEVLMPVVLPGELWAESGRLTAVGPELLRFKDRNDKEMLLGMTHEEAVVHMIRTEINSYKQLPCTVYQIQTKYRDEARPRAGLIRVREFTMKDAYSFHSSQACLEEHYARLHQAYTRIFERVGLTNVLSIESDTGMMGGSTAHEFMAVAECGEDTIFMSPDQTYKANRDVARSTYKVPQEPLKPLEKIHTPGQKTIADVAGFLNVPTHKTGKAVFYTAGDDDLIFAMIRGDLDVNETKLKNHLCVSDLKAATDQQIRAAGAEPGYASPVALSGSNVRLVVDPSVKGNPNIVVGANEPGYHYLNFNLERDADEEAISLETVDIATVRPGDPCPVTGAPLTAVRGIEVGNIFQLGTKYSEPMACTYLDQSGKSRHMIMGCYGIGVGRLMAAIIEQSHDEYGPIWPAAVSPFTMHMCALNPKKAGVSEAADQLYTDLCSAGIDVVYDDRGDKAGFQFNEADLIGVPHRLVVSPKTLAEGQAEYRSRDGKRVEMISLDGASRFVTNLVVPVAPETGM